MKKKIILAVLVLGLAVGGFFYWRQNQADVGELNKTLPDGVRVAKSLFGNEYKVVNKIDGYEFKVPKEWKGVEEIEYIPERTDRGHRIATIELNGKEGESVVAVINRFGPYTMKLDLESWAKGNFETFGLTGDFNKDNVGEIDVVKTQESVHLGGTFVYFFEKNSDVYTITCGSEEFIRYIIINGKW